MASVVELITFENPVFGTLLFYETLLVIKMMCMSLLTNIQRFRKKAFVNPEDTGIPGIKGAEIKTNEDVERVRRAHMNDIENITIFFVTGWLYIMTNPNQLVAQNLFRIYTLTRFVHTFVYAVFVIPQPARGISFFVGWAITGYMAIMAVVCYGSHLYF